MGPERSVPILTGRALRGRHLAGRTAPTAIPASIDASSQELVILSGCVVDPPIFYEGRDQFTLQLAPHARARVSLTLRDGETPPPLNYGQIVEFEGKVRPIRNFRNPGAFDFETFSARQQIYWSASVASGSPLKFLPGRCGSRFWAAIFGLRTAALERIDRLYPNNPYAVGMMDSILLGESARLEKVWTEDFRRTGTFHALVIAGLHISVLADRSCFCCASVVSQTCRRWLSPLCWRGSMRCAAAVMLR